MWNKLLLILLISGCGKWSPTIKVKADTKHEVNTNSKIEGEVNSNIIISGNITTQIEGFDNWIEACDNMEGDDRAECLKNVTGAMKGALLSIGEVLGGNNEF